MLAVLREEALWLFTDQRFDFQSGTHWTDRWQGCDLQLEWQRLASWVSLLSGGRIGAGTCSDVCVCLHMCVCMWECLYVCKIVGKLSFCVLCLIGFLCEVKLYVIWGFFAIWFIHLEVFEQGCNVHYVLFLGECSWYVCFTLLHSSCSVQMNMCYMAL